METNKGIITNSIIAGAMAISSTGQAQTDTHTDLRSSDLIRPFHIQISDAALTDLNKRIKDTRWPDKETVNNDSQGVQLGTMQKLASYWAKDYDWRKVEAKLNALPQFMTTIDGLDIYFIHVRSKEKNALPVIITHGWPGSVIEQLKIIGPLTDPVAYGGKAEDAFDVVIPSLPGHGFSGKPTGTGWDPVHVAKAWIELMKRLGYKKYVAQGGDWGNAISEIMALIAPPELLAIHTNMPATVPASIDQALASGTMPPDLTADEKNAYQQLDYFNNKGIAYALEMGNRPQTLYGIEDSPIGLAAWMLDHDIRSYELITRVFDGQKEGLSKDDILDNITLYWLTKTGVTSARLYWEAFQGPKGGFFDVRNVKIPVAVSVFPDEIYAAPQSWAQKAYPKLVYFNKVEKGGHFAAWEQPEQLSIELRAAFKSFR
ncbi:MAG TPA: alpha/beta fold hydrolase [Puia sp.]|nr:alpha/beta fold hydrolase [Puia sp.]